MYFSKAFTALSMSLFVTLANGGQSVAREDEIIDRVIADRYFLSGGCDRYLEKYSLMERTAFKDISRVVAIDDSIIYVIGGSSASERVIRALEVAGITIDKNVKFIRGQLKEKADLYDLFEWKEYSYQSRGKIMANRAFFVSGSDDVKSGAARSYELCELAAIASGRSDLKEYYEQYARYVLARPFKAQIGYFETAVERCSARERVGTGNQFAEPEIWDGSRFYILEVSFKNTDIESRLPQEGSLYIEYNGREYEFDSVESIVLDGYNVWLKAVNPLLTMRTKLVYRIPDEISGEAFWRPGRNSENIRLWCGNIQRAQ